MVNNYDNVVQVGDRAWIVSPDGSVDKDWHVVAVDCNAARHWFTLKHDHHDVTKLAHSEGTEGGRLLLFPKEVPQAVALQAISFGPHVLVARLSISREPPCYKFVCGRCHQVLELLHSYTESYLLSWDERRGIMGWRSEIVDDDRLPEDRLWCGCPGVNYPLCPVEIGD